VGAQTYYTIDGLYLRYAAARRQREKEVICAVKILKQNQSTEMRLLCFTGSGDNCNAYNVYKNPLNYLFPFSFNIMPPIMLIFLALLAAEQCVAVKLAADPLSRASQRRQISLPASLPAQTAGTGIGWLPYTMSVGGGYHFFGRKGRGYLNSDLRPTMPLTPSVSNYGRTPHGSKRCITQYVLNLFMT
jgi:hypothetical protein